MKRAIFIPIFILAGLIAAVLAYSNGKEPVPAQYISGATPGLVSAQAYILPVSNIGFTPIRNTAITDPIIDANEALIYDLDTGDFLLEKNVDVRTPVASLTKVLSALVAQERFLSQEIVTVASESIKVDGQKQTLYEGEHIYVKDLISMMLIESSNDAAYALANHASASGFDFVTEMNRKAQSLGMTNCMFTDPAGLDDQAYCTARDLIRLVRGALRQSPKLWSMTAQNQTVVTSVDGKISHTVNSTNKLLGQLEGIIGGKTGNTDGALGCFILLVKIPEKDDTLVSVVLGSQDRFGDTKTLIDWVRQAYNWDD